MGLLQNDCIFNEIQIFSYLLKAGQLKSRFFFKFYQNFYLSFSQSSFYQTKQLRNKFIFRSHH
ncbi:hypothetical protein pb186bvf_004411 [Paramecium bursaria]